MSEKGFIREIDKVGRIVLPMQIRKTLGIDGDGVKLSVTTDGHSIIVKKLSDYCALCGSSRGLTEFNSKHICKRCIAKIKEETK